MSMLTDLTKNIEFSHQIEKDACKFLEYHGCKEIAHHSGRVAYEAERLAGRFNTDCASLRTAGYLHDVGRIFPDNRMIDIAVELGIRVLDEERIYAGLLHQKLSKLLAYELFGIRDNKILNAVECHTTLRVKASPTDLILFIADKLSWDSSDNRPILDGISAGLEKSLEHGAFFYLNYLYENRNNIKVLHPWTLEAYNDLRRRCIER